MQTHLVDRKDNRITEFDFARGIAIICVCLVHFFAFAGSIGGYGIEWNPFLYFVKQYGGTFFVFLSGACCSLSSKNHTGRALTVLACAFALTAASVLLIKSGAEDSSVLIRCGILHTIGFAMLVYPLFKKWPAWAVLAVSAALIIAGYMAYFGFRVENEWLFIFGIRSYGFRDFDYFPLIPYLGWFMLGSAFCRLVYREKRSLLVWTGAENPVFRFFRWCGRNSLVIYMIQMPFFYILFRFLIHI